MKTKLSFLARSVIIVFMLLAGTVSGWAWATLTLRSDLNGDWNNNVGTFTSFINDGNHFKYEFTANSSKDIIHYRIHVSDNGSQIYPTSDNLDPTASGTYDVYANNNNTDWSFCSAIVYGHKYQILAEYLNEDGWKWKITFKEESTSPVEKEWYLAGSMNGSGNWDDQKVKMTESTTGVYTVTKSLTQGDYLFKIKDSSSWYGNSGTMTRINCSGWVMTTSEDDCKLTADVTGDYTFTFEESTKKLTVTYPEMSGATMYLRGSFNGDNRTSWDNLSRVMVETGKNTNVYEYSMPANTLSAGTYQFKFDMSGVTGAGNDWPDGLCWGYDLQKIDLNSTYTSVTTSGKATNIKLSLTSTDVTKTLKFMFNRNDMTFMVSSEELRDQNLRFENVTSTIEKDGPNVINRAVSDVTNTITYAVTMGDDVVSVDPSTGEVEALKEGTAIITASSPAIYGYYAATASYVITVTADEIPTIIFSPAGGTYTTNQNITITVSSDATSASYTVNNGTPITINDRTANVTVSTTSTITVTANYGSGKKVTKTATYTINKEQPTGKHSFTVYASVNNDFAWFPSDADNNEGCQAHGEDFYIFAYLTSDGNWSGYKTKSDVTYTKLTTNDFAPSKSTKGENNTYGDYWDGLEYPVYNDIRKQTFKRAKFTIYYDAALDGQTMFFTVNNGRGGKDGNDGYEDGCLRLACANKSYRGDVSKTLPYSYEWPSVTLEDGGKYYMLLDFHTHEHEAGYLDYGYYTNAADLTLEDIGQLLFTNVTYDDDFVANNGDPSIGVDHSGQTFYEYETATNNGQTYYTKLTNYWEQGKDYNVDFYRPFYSDGAYETICLPFDVTASEVEEYFGNGTQLYSIIGVSPTEICVSSESSITAGIPYLIIPTIQGHTWNAGAANGDAIKFTGREMKIAYDAGTLSDDPLPYTKDDEEETFTFKGCVLPVSLGSRDRFFNTSGTSASNSKLIYSQAYADRQIIRATRCFFTDTADPEVETNHDGQPINKVQAKRIRIDGFDDDDLATKVISLDGNTLKAVNDTNIYNMSGQRVAGSINSLSKGIYIIGGKKFAVK